MTSSFRVGMIGLGTVGSGVAKILTEHPERMEHRAGGKVELVRVAVRDPDLERDIKLPNGVLTDDVTRVTQADDIDVVVQVMGGIHPAHDFLMQSLRAGKDVVTANKALLANHGDELFHAARELGRAISFEAAVAGGVPLIASVGQSMAANQITSIEAILNGTSNFILTEMLSSGDSYATVLAEAQRLGYAEADPTMDVDGTDAAQKLIILVQLAFGVRVDVGAFPKQGLDSLALQDLLFGAELGYKIKMLAIARLHGNQVELHVQPTLVRKDRTIASTDGPYNTILLEGDAVGRIWLAGQGAGQMPTASAVVSDLISTVTGRAASSFCRLDLFGERDAYSVLPAEEISRRYYLRFNVEDRPLALANLTEIFGRNNISIASVVQHESPDPEKQPAQTVPLVFMTHRTTEGRMRAADLEFEKLDSTQPPYVRLPVAD